MLFKLPYKLELQCISRDIVPTETFALILLQ